MGSEGGTASPGLAGVTVTWRMPSSLGSVACLAVVGPAGGLAFEPHAPAPTRRRPTRAERPAFVNILHTERRSMSVLRPPRYQRLAKVASGVAGTVRCI